MFTIINNPNDTYTLTSDDDTNRIIDNLTIDELGEIVLAAVSAVNPAMGETLRSLMPPPVDA